MSIEDIEYGLEIYDFPEASEVVELTTPKEELYQAKKKSFILALGGDITNRAKNQGENYAVANIAYNFYGLFEDDRKRLIDETVDFLHSKGYETTTEDKEQNSNLTTVLTIKWSKRD